MTDLGPTITPSGQRLYDSIPPVFANDEENNWFGKYLCQSIMSMLQDFDSIVLDHSPGIHPITGEEERGMKEHAGWTAALDPVTCPEAWLKWCELVYGVVQVPNSTAPERRERLKQLPAQQRGGIRAMEQAAIASFPAQSSRLALFSIVAGSRRVRPYGSPTEELGTYEAARVGFPISGTGVAVGTVIESKEQSEGAWWLNLSQSASITGNYVLGFFTNASRIRFIERNNNKGYQLLAHVMPKQNPAEEAATKLALLTQKPAGVKLEYITSDAPLIDDGTKTIDASTGEIDTAKLTDVT